MYLDENKVRAFREALLRWGKENRRWYPWRGERDPYKILIAEFMLHRTQADQVLPVYRAFTERYPTLESAVHSSDEEFAALMYPLGLHWRTRLMKKALTYLWRKYQRIPDDEELLTSAPGIGPYIANATICFSKNTCRPLADTNTVRVIGRFFGLRNDENARRREEMIRSIGQACDPADPRNYYFSLIDFAHSVCTKINPRCPECPLARAGCGYHITLHP